MYIVVGFDNGNLCLMTSRIFTDYKLAKEYADGCSKLWCATVMQQIKE